MIVEFTSGSGSKWVRGTARELLGDEVVDAVSFAQTHDEIATILKGVSSEYFNDIRERDFIEYSSLEDAIANGYEE